jgi:hypothetical protein
MNTKIDTLSMIIMSLVAILFFVIVWVPLFIIGIILFYLGRVGWYILNWIGIRL